MPETIFEYITTEENRFNTDEVQIADNWMWNMKSHLQMSFQFINGKFTTGANDWTRYFKNIIQPLLNLRYWAEDIELKDVVLYVEDEPDRVLSFLLKKYHDEIYVKENDLDTFFDELEEDDIDYGGVLIQKTNDARPEVLSLLTIAFCDQTDIFGGPIAFKFNFSPDKLRSMSSKGWGNKANGATATIEDLIDQAKAEKESVGQYGNKNKTTGKNIEVYVLRGTLPESYLKEKGKAETYVNQIQIVAFYSTKKEKSGKKGVILYRQKETESSLKFNTSDKKIHGRALGRGGAESLFQDQIWSNFTEIHKMKLLEAASKVVLYTDDQNYKDRNKIQDMENLEITMTDDGKQIRQVPTVGVANIQLFEKSINEFYEHAQLVGSAFDPILGKEPPSGTTFRGQAQVVSQGRGLHERRRGKRAKFIEEIYRDWIIPQMTRAIIKGKKFLATLSVEDMKWVSERLADNYANRTINEAILDGSDKQFQDKETLRQEFLKTFSKKGNKHLIEILKDEFKNRTIKININVAGKQKNLAGLSDKVFSIFQLAFSNPMAFQQVLQIPGMQNAFNDILEFSGISQTDFNGVVPQLPQTQQPALQPQVPQIPQPA